MEIRREIKPREQLLLLLFPAAILLAVYSVFVAIPGQQRLRNEQAKLQLTQAQAVTPADAESSLGQLENTQRSLQRMKASVTSNREQVRALSQAWRRTDNRLATFQLITEKLRFHELSVVFQGYMSEVDISEYHQKLIELINRQEPEIAVEFWQIELKGSFLHVTEFLESIDGDQLGIIPIAIAMKSSSDPRDPKSWTIVFLI